MSMSAEQGHLSSGQDGEDAAAQYSGRSCFGCGADNPTGLGLKFYSKPEMPRRVYCDARIARSFEGPPGHVHGGIIATILDEAMGKANKQNGVAGLTRAMDIQFLRPVPLNAPLHIEGWNERRHGRKNFNAARIQNEAGEILATATGLFIEVDEEIVRRALQKTSQVE